ncbi:MAG: PD-(D/E)XK nuclease family protein [Bdellovibrio sp.]
MKYGQKIHKNFSDAENRNPNSPARIFSFIKRQEPGVKFVKWFLNSPESNLRRAKLPLSGRPDGMIQFVDGTRAIIELKTVSRLPEQPRYEDFFQAEVYSLLYSSQSDIGDDCFVLYKERFTHELALFKKRKTLTESTLSAIVGKIQRGSYSIDDLVQTQCSSRCVSCGFRWVCLRK